MLLLVRFVDILASFILSCRMIEGFSITCFDCQVVTGSCFPAAPWQPFFTSDVTTFYRFDRPIVSIEPSQLLACWPAVLAACCAVNVANQPAAPGSFQLASLAVNLDQRQRTLIKVS